MRRTDDSRTARRIVQGYLNECGGEPAGFDYGAQEESLAAVIRMALHRARAEERRTATPRRPPAKRRAG